MILDSAVLYSNDVPKAVEFYTKILGLELEFIDGERFAQLKFENGLKLSIKKQVEEREVPGHQTFFIAYENVEALYEKLKEKEEVDFKKELTEESFGTHFSIFDPDKNKVEFIRRK